MERFISLIIIIVCVFVAQPCFAKQQMVFETECSWDRSGQTYPENIYKVLDQADKLFQKHQYQRAYGILNKASRTYYEVGSIWRAKACALIAMNKPHQAIKETDKGLDYSLGDTTLMTYRLAAFLNAKKWDEGARYGEFIIKQHPNEPAFYTIYGMILQNLNQEEKARKQYSYLLAHAPNYAPMYYLRGTSFERDGQYTQALADLNKAIKLEPDTMGYYIERARIYNKLGEKQKTKQDIDKSLSMGGKPKEIHKIVFAKN